MIAYEPDWSVFIVGAVGAALCGLALFGIPLTWFTYIFVFLVCFTAWIPLSVNIGGLNLRASQFMLPVVFVRLWMQRPFVTIRRSSLVLLVSGGLLWGTLLFWTVANIDSYASVARPLGHVFLLGLNLLHTVAIYLLVIRTRRLYETLISFLSSVTVLNGILLTIVVGSALGISALQGFIAQEAGEILLQGQLAGGLVPRFKFAGVIAGCVSAAAFALALCLLLNRKRKRVWSLWICVFMAGAGVVIGFSRQGFVSLVAGLIVAGLYLTSHGQVSRVLKVALVLTLVATVGIWGVSQLPGGRGFVQAFLGRVSLLFQSTSYRTGTVGARTAMWSGMLADVARNPFRGNGQDAYLRYIAPGQEGSHNFPLEVLCATGLSGFIPYVLFHAAILVSARRAVSRREAGELSRWMLLGLVGAYVAVWLASVTNLIFWNPTYWLVIGLLVAGTRLTRKRLADTLGYRQDRTVSMQVTGARGGARL